MASDVVASSNQSTALAEGRGLRNSFSIFYQLNNQPEKVFVKRQNVGFVF